jgi:endoglucanase
MSNAKEIMGLMKCGICLGNRFDNPQHSTVPEDIYPFLSAMYSKGFRTIRIPVTWRPGTATQDLFEINSPLIDQLAKVVDRALTLGFYVIVNTHHESWIDEKYDGGTYWDDKFRSLWIKIATLFKDKSYKLMFEVKNEPASALGDYSTPGAPDPSLPHVIELTRKMNQCGYDAIRSVSPTRIIMIAPNAKGNIESGPRVYPTPDTLPGKGEDKWLVVTLHSYDSLQFCGESGCDSYYTLRANPVESLRMDVNAAFSRLMTWYNSMLVGAPYLGLNIGEIGVGRIDPSKRDSAITRDHYYYWSKKARENGVSIIAWCDGPGGCFSCCDMEDGVCTFPYGLADAFLACQK